MSRKNDVSAMLQQYAAETGVRSVQKVEADFVEVAQKLPPEELTTGLAEAIHSEHTPSFEEMVGESFARGDKEQKADMLKRLLAGVGPAALQSLVEQGVLRADVRQAPIEAIGVEQASRLTPELVQRIAQEATRHDPGLIERMTSFYAENPDLGKTLGGAALSVALGRLAQSL